MICDKLENADLYAALGPEFAQALDLLRSSQIINGADGKYSLEGSRIWYLIQRYKTKPVNSCNFESHRKFVDIQFIVSGEELIGHSYPDHLTILSAYDAVSDKTLYEVRTLEKLSMIRLSGGMFGIFFPHDAHLPCLQSGETSDVHKVVIKVPVHQE